MSARPKSKPAPRRSARRRLAPVIPWWLGRDPYSGREYDAHGKRPRHTFHGRRGE